MAEEKDSDVRPGKDSPVSLSDENASDSAVDPNASSDEVKTCELDDEAVADESAETSPEIALEEVREQLADAEDRALRAVAEADNIRKRAEKAVENAHKYALESLTEKLLPVLDSFEKAVEKAADDGQESDGSVHATLEGVELSYRLFIDVLKKAGIKSIDPTGEPFDPEYHEAMSMLENPDAEPGSVLEVVQKGYILNDRLVRPARVLVAKDMSEPKKTP
ncbi:MAG: nucleotide exchange factor GrpE [Pseudomonadota bacterium]|nr:nucleotide exchange factor GrpE [Pseudomonadota bacterium]